MRTTAYQCLPRASSLSEAAAYPKGLDPCKAISSRTYSMAACRESRCPEPDHDSSTLLETGLSFWVFAARSRAGHAATAAHAASR